MNENKNENTDKDFPGYPHYPANEDIMNQKDVEQVDLDVENLSRSKNTSGIPDRSAKKEIPAKEEDLNVDEEEVVATNDADLTPDDLLILEDADSELSNSEELSGDDLDVPGSEDDDANEEIGEEDEENNYYSLGGDAHDDLEEDKG